MMTKTLLRIAVPLMAALFLAYLLTGTGDSEEDLSLPASQSSRSAVAAGAESLADPGVRRERESVQRDDVAGPGSPMEIAHLRIVSKGSGTGIPFARIQVPSGVTHRADDLGFVTLGGKADADFLVLAAGYESERFSTDGMAMKVKQDPLWPAPFATIALTPSAVCRVQVFDEQGAVVVGAAVSFYGCGPGVRLAEGDALLQERTDEDGYCEVLSSVNLMAAAAFGSMVTWAELSLSDGPVRRLTLLPTRRLLVEEVTKSAPLGGVAFSVDRGSDSFQEGVTYVSAEDGSLTLPELIGGETVIVREAGYEFVESKSGDYGLIFPKVAQLNPIGPDGGVLALHDIASHLLLLDEAGTPIPLKRVDYNVEFLGQVGAWEMTPTVTTRRIGGAFRLDVRQYADDTFRVEVRAQDWAPVHVSGEQLLASTRESPASVTLKPAEYRGVYIRDLSGRPFRGEILVRAGFESSYNLIQGTPHAEGYVGSIPQSTEWLRVMVVLSGELSAFEPGTRQIFSERVGPRMDSEPIVVTVDEPLGSVSLRLSGSDYAQSCCLGSQAARCFGEVGVDGLLHLDGVPLGKYHIGGEAAVSQLIRRTDAGANSLLIDVQGDVALDKDVDSLFCTARAETNVIARSAGSLMYVPVYGVMPESVSGFPISESDCQAMPPDGVIVNHPGEATHVGYLMVLPASQLWENQRRGEGRRVVAAVDRGSHLILEFGSLRMIREDSAARSLVERVHLSMEPDPELKTGELASRTRLSPYSSSFLLSAHNSTLLEGIPAGTYLVGLPGAPKKRITVTGGGLTEITY
ncbi:hypothetical protein Poly30_13540 [Planctomycetes bacterium Poly30]|uniref:Uncharacterized protein n=1 Tax=Saltatorellus ferox TaxID=2528018 RepID=A0A518EP37_9BACT|nr:hypothetical protein Poly30_13540 [Planctomycetes bacterium Poly30]